MTERLDLADMQGLLVRGYGDLPYATFLLLEFRDPQAARPLLGRWAAAVTPADQSPREAATALAFTAEGLRALLAAPQLPPGFVEPYMSGMVTPYRSRLLGDVGANTPASWVWGGPAGDPVHGTLLLYDANSRRLQARVRETSSDAERHSVRVVRTLDTDKLSDREHFGFRDGISQPLLAGLPRAGKGESVLAGEFVLGYVNEYGQRSDRPLLAADADPTGVLPRDPDGSGAPDLGRNGSYLVFRQLRQDVDGFWAYVERARAPGQSRELFAAKLVGRWPSGAPLVLAPQYDNEALAIANDFGYHHEDPTGYACPIGSHTRRANPRDALDPSPGTQRSLEVNRRHRLLRRGRNYTYPAGGEGVPERGLYFMCLNTSLSRQYEFVQHTWINDPNFNGLYEDEDPLIGPRTAGPTTFVEPARPVRRRHRDLPGFVQVRGGGYFFLPGLRALRWVTSGATITSANS